MASKSDRAAAARAKAQAEVKAKERRTTAIIIASALVVIALFAGVIYFIVGSSKTPTLEDVAWPAGADKTGGILVDGADAATRVDVYFDFMCPFCGIFETNNGAMLASKAEAGDIALYYHPLSFLDRASAGSKFSTRAANAAAVVADRSPEHFVPFVLAMFANQPDENTPGLSDDQIASIAVGAGVPQDVAATFADGEFTDWVIAATQQASIDGVGSTPSIMVNRTLVPQEQVPWMQDGVLQRYLESVIGG